MSAERTRVDLSRFDNASFPKGAGAVKMTLWYFTNVFFFLNPAFPFRSVKPGLLRLFGAKVGKRVVIHPGVNIKYPWFLSVGDHCWIGEGVWIDNLAQVTLGSHVCLSQGAMLLTGNHDYTKPSFNLITQPIVLEDGVWVGARALVGPGAVLRTHAVLSAGSVGTGELEAYAVYRGNPAVWVRKRVP